jgi:hypothetical protein
MELTERYRTEAEHCLREAAQLRDRGRRATWEAFARRWLELAGQVKLRAPQPTLKRRTTVSRTRRPA